MAFVLEVCIKYISKSTSCLVPDVSQRHKSIMFYVWVLYLRCASNNHLCMAFVYEVCIKYINKSKSCLVPEMSQRPISIMFYIWGLYLRCASNN